MPRVRMLQAVAGLDFSWAPGEVVTMTPDQADAWADGVRGELVRDEPQERAVTTAAETTARRSRAGRRG